MAKLLSYNCRYLDNICTINFKYFGDIAIYIYIYIYIYICLGYIYMRAYCCSKVVHAVTNRTPSWIFIYRVVDGKFVTGIYQEVDDFNFEVINYPFPQSNIHSMSGYTTFYSQLIRFFRLCNNINDFLFRAKLSYFQVGQTWLYT